MPHIQHDGRTLFVTFATHRRWILPEAARAVILEHCVHDHGAKIHLHATVVMPDHVHLLFTPLSDRTGATFGQAEIMSGIKGSSAHAVNHLLRRTGRVWQPESFDRIVRHDEDARSKAEYICANPVRAGLAASEYDWPWTWREWLEGASEQT